MATQSPRALSPAVAVLKEKKLPAYHVDLQQLGQKLDDIKILHKALMDLQSALSKAGKGAFLTFPEDENNLDGNRFTFTKANLKQANARYNALVKDVKKFVVASRKKTTSRGDPSTFSGIYSPIFATDALRAFFTSNAENFSIRRPDDVALLQRYVDGLAAAQQSADVNVSTKAKDTLDKVIVTIPVAQNLIANLPKVQQGFLLRNTCTILFFIYAKANHLHEDNAQYVHADEVMNAAFGDNIAAMHYVLPSGDKIFMETAVKNGTVPRALNTYEVINNIYQVPPNEAVYINELKNVNRVGDRFADDDAGKAASKEAIKREKTRLKVYFTPNYFASYMFQNLASPNYISAKMAAENGLQEVYDGLTDKASRAEMLREHQLVGDVKNLWSDMLAPSQKAKRDANKKAKDAAKPKKPRKARNARK